MGLEEYGFRDVNLMEGERLDSALNLTSDGRFDLDDGPEVMLLTDKRVIHLHGKSKRRQAIFASIQDIDGVEITVQKEGFSAFVWTALAFVVAAMLYVAIDNTAVRIFAAVAVASMGAYLLVDRLMTPGRPLVAFKAGSSQLLCELKSDKATTDIYPFINRLFFLKDENGAGDAYRARRFAPR